MLIRCQADPVLAHAKGVAAHVLHRLIVDRIAGVTIADRAAFHRRADLSAGQIVDRHGDEAGRIAFAQFDALCAELRRRAARSPAERGQAEGAPRLRAAQRHGNAFIGDKRDIVRQEDAQRYPLALLGEAGNLLIALTARKQARGKFRRVQHGGHVRRVLHAIAVEIVQRHRHGLREAHVREPVIGRRHRAQRLQAGTVGVGKIEAQCQRLLRVVLQVMMRIAGVKARRLERDVHALRTIRILLGLSADQLVVLPGNAHAAQRTFGDQIARKVDVAVV